MAASVEFNTGVDDPLQFACRLLRKAARTGVRVLASAPAAELAALDELLWTFDAQDFVPHVRVSGPGARLAARTPIWLASVVDPPSPVADVRPRVLVNLGCPPPDDPEAFDRIIEIVGTDPAQVQAGRVRWAHYLGWGDKPLHRGAA